LHLRTKSLIILLLAILTVSCGYWERKRQNILPEKEVVNLLTDLYITNSYIHTSKDSLVLAGKSDTLWNRAVFSTVFEEHNTTPEELQKSLLYYSSKLKTLENIYDEVIAKLVVIEAENQATQQQISN
jgi:hypothetical protein